MRLRRSVSPSGVSALRLFRWTAELLLSARLLPEARGQIDAVVKELEVSGTSLDLAEARLLLSQVALAAGRSCRLDCGGSRHTFASSLQLAGRTAVARALARFSGKSVPGGPEGAGAGAGVPAEARAPEEVAAAAKQLRS